MSGNDSCCDYCYTDVNDKCTKECQCPECLNKKEQARLDKQEEKWRDKNAPCFYI